MTRLSTHVLAALAVAAGLASVSPAARADQPAPVSKGGETATSDKNPTGTNLAVATAAQVAEISPANVAGLLNYCVETEQVSHEDGDAVQTALNAKTNAVPTDHAGNMDYAIGTAGQFLVGGKASTLTGLDQPAQGKLCTVVLARSRSLI
ncbi:hypothetical protein AA23498_1558 [Acetobacter nitrogenifigens DSM 23921 = NBRC 105050]|uniref:Alcohol dehydrogenase n=1 Tax=Acetobacter nitrogenifigens DSM 23921 = NBRC 105050 TaxID=1120919 RepID=A0A511XB17_9PROT|nr:hypothetical protein [Acetobacter nitrogenifigens]GBQ92820.1 hypothetical protein AA23498_1558 [Acetobacter nitrogenifigens DSM 23921 = NBRC 105050]GEN60140.1 hypothetical protein ANI02nite_20240 [Acetobacter nitrogenifigens DSM 23921 = NBRC 105050]